MFDLNLQESLLFALLAIFIGCSKGGLPGVGILVVPMMAHLFPAKVSTGVLLPMLLMADVFAVIYYHRYADWKCLGQLFPPTIAGVVLAYGLMDHLDDQQVKKGIAIIILFMSALLFCKLQGYWLKTPPKSKTFIIASGLLVGIATMFANAAGPIAAIYLLAIGMEKEEFIGTKAWFFLLLNAFKIPFSFHLGLIQTESLLLNLKGLPLIALGIWIGIKLVKRIQPKVFSRIVLGLAVVSALKMLF